MRRGRCDMNYTGVGRRWLGHSQTSPVDNLARSAPPPAHGQMIPGKKMECHKLILIRFCAPHPTDLATPNHFQPGLNLSVDSNPISELCNSIVKQVQFELDTDIKFGVNIHSDKCYMSQCPDISWKPNFWPSFWRLENPNCGVSLTKNINSN